MNSVAPIKVSVCLTTYNHAPFIGEAIEGVLAQQTDFPIEIIIGEDDSTDGTRDIVRQYAQRHPELIKPFFNDRANVIFIDGRPTGRWNFMNNVR
jgi:glycosyltransferase involved in cell wall biosynthesis